MPLNLPNRILYLITSGATTAATTPASKEYAQIIKLVEAAVDTRFNLLQIREKNLTARVLYDLGAEACEITRASETRLLINDRADIARAVGADGVHLTSRSIPPHVVRETFGPDFLIGVSTHSEQEVDLAHEGGADFAVLGPVFETKSKRVYGEPMGLDRFASTIAKFPTFPILALGGITLENAAACVRAGARGVAAIGLFQEANELRQVVTTLRKSFESLAD